MNALAILLLALVVWITWPLPASTRTRWGLLALIVFVPAAWLVLVPLGIRRRYRDSKTATTFTRAAQEIDHGRDVKYWRGLLETGTPAERVVAQDLLAHWGEPTTTPTAIVGQPADFDHLH